MVNSSILTDVNEYICAGVEVHITITGQFTDKPTRGQSSRGLDNLRTSQLADSEFLKIMELLYIYRLLFILQLRDAEFNDDDDTHRNNLTRRLQIVIYTQTTRFNI